ncbi:MAG: 50S ribosomal protein L4 [Candidatus Nealsonbacteria bacterium CG_4_8_14_3_um_filter_39_7]|nr:MAG: 50S ribosomal protein L4 [Candidatus Nealsonbacteria bacterium CG_4_8_14_3_um_filter_39_7]
MVMFVVKNKKGEETGRTELPSAIFGVKMNNDLVYQVAVSQMANKRQVSAHTKDRGDVSGGGKKPWRQKGTGRARVGSNRSPIWIGGGVTFGPTNERVFKKKLNKKMKRKALFMVLSSRVENNSLILLDVLESENAKTKEMATLIKNVKNETSKEVVKETAGAETKKKARKGWKESILIVLPKMEKKIIMASRNIAKVKTIQAKDLNCLDTLNSKYIIMPESAVNVIKETFTR